jgi:hypothetical protein
MAVNDIVVVARQTLRSHKHTSKDPTQTLSITNKSLTQRGSQVFFNKSRTLSTERDEEINPKWLLSFRIVGITLGLIGEMISFMNKN